MTFLPAWQHLEMNGKPEEINKDRYHYQTQHSCQEVSTNFKLKENKKKTTVLHNFSSAFKDLQACHQ